MRAAFRSQGNEEFGGALRMASPTSAIMLVFRFEPGQYSSRAAGTLTVGGSALPWQLDDHGPPKLAAVAVQADNRASTYVIPLDAVMKQLRDGTAQTVASRFLKCPVAMLRELNFFLQRRDYDQPSRHQIVSSYRDLIGRQNHRLLTCDVTSAQAYEAVTQMYFVDFAPAREQESPDLFARM